jgi:hypothetical protein
MALFCAYNIDWSDFGDALQTTAGDDGKDVHPDKSIVPGCFAMAYTVEEELWVTEQIRLVNEAIRSVSVSDELSREFFMISMGKKVSGDHIPGMFKILVERLWRVSKIHQDFQDLPAKNQASVMESNGKLGLALLIVKAENCSNGIEQLQDGFGIEDKAKWKRDYLPMFEDLSQIKKNCIFDSMCFSDQEAEEFLALVESARCRFY